MGENCQPLRRIIPLPDPFCSFFQFFIRFPDDLFIFFLSAAIASVCGDGSMFTFSLHSEKLPLGVDGIGDIGRGNWSNSSKE